MENAPERRTSDSIEKPPVAEATSPAAVVLIVDDDVDTRELYADCLTAQGMRVLCAENGAVGVDKALQVLPQVIVMDLAMPVMGGLEAIERLKRDERTQDVPVVVLSADATAERARLTKAGCSASLSKPCLPADLEDVIIAVIESRGL